MKKIANRLQHLPIAYTGLALGIGGFGNGVFQIFNVNGYNAQWITCISISFVILFLIMMFTKNIVHPRVLNYELREPFSVSLLPTFTMSLMLVAGFIGMWDKSSRTSPNQIVAAIIMCLAISLQFIIIGFFIKSFITNHIRSKEQHMYGSYFVPIVGLITSCTVAHNVIALPNVFFQVIWYIGYISFIFTLPVFTYSLLFKEKKVSDAQFPSVAVWFSPANLSCAGFLQVFMLAPNSPYKMHTYNEHFLFVILILTVVIGFCTSLLLYLYIFRIFMIKWKAKQKNFSPILCSLSFPCAIGATAMIWTAKVLTYKFFNSSVVTQCADALQQSAVWFFGISGLIFSILTALIIGYLLINMIILACKILFTTKHDDNIHDVYKNN